MPPEPESMTEEKWAALEAAYKAATPGPYLAGRSFAPQEYAVTANQVSIGLYWKRENSVFQAEIMNAIPSILAYHKKAEEIRRVAEDAKRWLDDLIRLTTHIGRETNWNPKLTKHIEALGRLRAALGVNR